MSKLNKGFEQGLSIQELEDRHELTVAIPTDTAKDDGNDTTIERCNDNSGG